MIPSEHGPAALTRPLDVWIDADPSIGIPGHEAADGFALVQAFHSPELRIRGISASYGNAPLEKTARIARQIVEQFGAAAGVTPGRLAAGAPGRQALGQGTAATAALRAALEERPLTYLALAPLTNLATLLTLHPELSGRIEKIIFVGARSPGRRITAGKWNPYEFTDSNYHKDNRAAGVVLRAGVPLKLVPLELAFQMPLRPAELRWIGREGGPEGRYLAQKASLWMWLWRLGFLTHGAMIFDSFAVLAATHPHLLETERRFVSQHNALDWNAPQEHHKYLLASQSPLGRKPAREAEFCCTPKPGARPALLERLAGKPYLEGETKRTP